MKKLKSVLRAWTPAIGMMGLIFLFSSRTPGELPTFATADALVKKGGHALGYGLLALAYWRGMGTRAGRQPIAWLLAIAYSATDEFHQSFVPGRHPSPLDVVLFDNLGAILALLACTAFLRRRAAARAGDPSGV
jgi:VanZ family protein